MSGTGISSSVAWGCGKAAYLGWGRKIGGGRVVPGITSGKDDGQHYTTYSVASGSPPTDYTTSRGEGGLGIKRGRAQGRGPCFPVVLFS